MTDFEKFCKERKICKFCAYDLVFDCEPSQEEDALINENKDCGLFGEFNLLIWLTKDGLTAEPSLDGNFERYERKINYCPMCGRKLGKE